MGNRRPSLGRGSAWFDGPGARPILGEPGPSSASLKASPQPDEHAFGDSQSGSGGYGSQPSRVEDTPSTSHPPHPSAPPPQRVIKRVGGKANVSSACGPCKRAHLACDVARPCKRCVNIGKEDQCEDVPHKKRGRPKVNKTPSVDPYARPPPRPAPPPTDESKWRPPSSAAYDPPYPTSTTSPPVQLGSLAPRMSSPASRPPMMSPLGPYDPAGVSPYSGPPPPGPPVSGPGPLPGAAHPVRPGSSHDRPPTFTLFCATDLKILRATEDCFTYLGYHQQEFANLPLLNWIHPSDRHLIEMDRSQLLNVSYLANSPQSSRETLLAVSTADERELMSPAVGMNEPYPNQSVRMWHADNTYSYFNVRMHLGGGLGGSLWQPETLGKIYLVVSCLSIPSDPSQEPRRHYPSPPAAAPQPPAPLPSFSSIAAAADAPSSSPPHYGTSSSYHRPPSAPAPVHYYSRPTTSSSSPYPTGPSGPSPRARSPAMPAPYSASSYHSYPPPQPHPPPGSYYMPPGQYDRRASDDEWRRHGHTLPSPGPPSGAPPPADYRRGWDRP